MAGARGGFNSRFGFIMAAVGSAVGLGNLVRFPAELNENGGAAFLLVYIALLFLVGLPAILGEMSIGKIANASPVTAFKELAKTGKKFWAIVGLFATMGAVFVMFFYTVLAGWALRFFFETFRDGWWDNTALIDTAQLGPWAVIWHFLVTAATVYIVARGVSGGIEKVTVIIMPALFAIIIGIVVFTLFQDGMGAGYAAIFKPDFSELTFAKVSAAVGQVFFSLSLGQGAMLTYASYMQKKQSVTEDGLTIGLADTGVAILAGMMIFPTLAFAGLLTDAAVVGEDANPLTIAYKAMPAAFIAMGGFGKVMGAIFFLGLFFAALSSAISLLEVPVSVLVDNMKLGRTKAALIMGLVTYTFGVLAASFPHFLDLYDEIAVNLFIVIAVLLTTVFAGWFVGKKMDNELSANTRFKLTTPMLWMMRTVTPALIFFVFIAGGFLGGESGYEFWGEGAGFKKLGHTMKVAFTGGE